MAKPPPGTPWPGPGKPPPGATKLPTDRAILLVLTGAHPTPSGTHNLTLDTEMVYLLQQGYLEVWQNIDGQLSMGLTEAGWYWALRQPSAPKP